MVQVSTTNVTYLSSNISDAKLFDKHPKRNSTCVDNIVSACQLNDHIDDSLVLKIFSKSQNSSFTGNYLEVFMDNISMVEITFGRNFQDGLLC